MLAHRARGDRDAALRAYARCLAVLGEDLGVAPAAETARLHAEILREDAPARSAPVGRLRAAEPIAYADCGGVRIAYQAVGQGPVDLVFSPSSVTNLGATWEDPTYAAFLRRLASMARLILFDKRGTWGWTAERYQRLVAAFEEAWLGDGEGLPRRNPSLAANPRYRDWFARYVRLGASPWMARRLTELNAALDVRPVLGAIRAPCLVICTAEDVWISPENSRYLAREIPGARLLELPGLDHDPWVGDSEPILEAVEGFLAGLARPAEAAAAP